MDAFLLLSKVTEISSSIEEAKEFIHGGVLTDVLDEVGEVLLESAIDHLKQARASHSPERRLGEAAEDLQTAYFAFARGASRGPSRVLRRWFDLGSLEKTRGKASGCASTVALLLWCTNESSGNIRVWLDRTAKQLSEHFRDVRAVARDRPSALGGGNEGYDWKMKSFHLGNYFSHYFQLERNLLPAHLVRPLPPAFTPRNILAQSLGISFSQLEAHWQLVDEYSDSQYLPQYDPSV